MPVWLCCRMVHVMFRISTEHNLTYSFFVHSLLPSYAVLPTSFPTRDPKQGNINMWKWKYSHTVLISVKFITCNSFSVSHHKLSYVVFHSTMLFVVLHCFRVLNSYHQWKGCVHMACLLCVQWEACEFYHLQILSPSVKMSVSYHLLHNIHVQVALWTWEKDSPLDTRFLNMLKCTDTAMPNHRAGE